MGSRLSIALLTLFISLFCTEAFAAEGRTAGEFAVSQRGSAQYTIPIWAPQGPRGVQPKLSLIYNSHSGIGPLGIGWSLVGLGAVSRCTKTYAQDTTPAAVALATSDGYCLNGKRLRLTGGTYGAAGSTYQTEIADFSNVTANGTAGNGPAFFTVQGRDGLTYQYGYTDANGNGANSQVLATGTPTADLWLLSKVVDRAGNNLVINYTAQTGTAVPNDILWTPTSAGASTYAYKMLFNYTTNAPPSSLTKYIGGTAVKNTELLSSIAISYQGTVLKDYFLGYQASPTTGRNELISVTECADSGGSNCLLPTSITYQNGTAGVSTTATTALSSSGTGLSARYDLNGDGYPDLVYGSGSTWYVSFGSASGYGAPVNTGVPYYSNTLFGNLTGGSKDGILGINGSTWWYYTWNGSSFTGSSTGLAYDSIASQYQLADIDGDGRPDLISLYVTYSSQQGKYIATIDTRLNTSTGGAVSFSSTLTTAYTNGGGLHGVAGAQLRTPDLQYGKLRRYDFDGDGRDDVALMIVTGSGGSYTVSTYELLSTSTGFNQVLIDTISGNSYGPVFFTNWNDDACTDFVTGTTLYISGCNGTIPATYTLSGVLLGAMDWDGDGRTDLLVANGATLGVYLSTGAEPGALLPTSIPYTSTCQYVTLDVNGDGLDDLGCWNQSGSNPLTYRLHNGAGQPPDLASSIKDGYGNSVSPTYVSLVQSDYSPYSDATWPYQNYIGPMYVVNEAIFSDPSNMPNGTYNQQFYYYGAWTNLQGRGFQSFYATRTLDSRNGLYDYQYYERSFPYNGMKFQEIVSNGTFYPSQTTATPAATTLDSTANNERYFPYFSNVITYQREVGGSENGDLIGTASTNYTYDSYGNATNVATTVTDNDPGSPYLNDTWTTATANTIAPNTATWCLGLPTVTTLTNSSTAPGGAAITRTVNYTPDYTNCRQTQRVIEPNSATYKVTEGYTYDSFGNLWTDTVTGVGMTARVTTTTWGTTGQFPATQMNALNQTTQVNYDPNSGKILSIKDPNGIQTNWQYDAFERKANELRPDGTSTTWAYNSCAAAGCVNSNNKMTVVQTNLNVGGGSTLNISNTYVDSLDRVLVTSKQLVSGAYDRNETQYDNLGNVHQKAVPCLFASCTTYWTVNTYDALNRLTQTQRPISASNGTLQTTTINYAGRTTTTTDPQGKTTTITKKVTGSVGRTKDHNGYYVSFNHDAFGSVLSITDSLSNTLRSMAYDYGLGTFPRTLSDTDLGTRSYAFDALGEMTSYSDSKNQSFSITYDALSRATSRTEPDLTTTWTWGNTAASFNIGKLQSVTAASSAGTYSEAYGYDSKTRLSTKQITIPGDTAYTYTSTYNATTGLLDTLQYPISTAGYQLKLQYAYQSGILQQISDVTTGTHYWTANAINPRGQYTQETLGNQVVVNHALDAVTGWVSSIQAGVGGGAALQNNSYLFDEMGNLTQRQDNNLGLTENAYPDSLYRLDHTVGDSNTQMTYDGMGRILTWAAYGKPTVVNNFTTAQSGCTYYANSQVHAVRSSTAGTQPPQSYCYDANGNLTKISASGNTLGSVAWTSFNQPSDITSGTTTGQLYYNADHQRYKQAATYAGSPETTVYVGGLLEKVSNSSGTAYRHYIPAGNNLVVYTRWSTGSNPTYYITKDHLGSSAVITDQTGALIVKERFGAQGYNENTATEQATIASISRHEFTGQEQIDNTGVLLTNMNGRIYSPVGSLFFSPDPYVPDPGNTQSYNRYSYVKNNPLTRIDPSGFADGPPQICIDNCQTTNNGQGAGQWAFAWNDPTARRECDGNCSAYNTTSSNGNGGVSGSPSGGTTTADSTANSTTTSDPTTNNITTGGNDQAQGQNSALNDSNFFSPQNAANGPVFVDNTGAMQNTGSSSALNGNYFSVAAFADMASEVTAGLSTVASFVEATVRSAAEFAHSFGVVGLAFGTGADFISLNNNGISQTQFNVNLGVGAAGLAGGVLTALPSAQYFIATWSYNHFYPGGSQQAWQVVGSSLNNMSSNGLGP